MKHDYTNTEDRGVDIHAYREGQTQVVRLIAQCKRYKKNVGSPELREFLGSHVIAELVGAHIDEKWLFALYGFTADCIEQARLAGVKLIGGNTLTT